MTTDLPKGAATDEEIARLLEQFPSVRTSNGQWTYRGRMLSLIARIRHDGERIAELEERVSYWRGAAERLERERDEARANLASMAREFDRRQGVEESYAIAALKNENAKLRAALEKAERSNRMLQRDVVWLYRAVTTWGGKVSDLGKSEQKVLDWVRVTRTEEARGGGDE